MAQKARTIDLKSIDKTVKNEAMIGVQNTDVNSKLVCGNCLIEKQTKAANKSLKESLGGKKYVFVGEEDFSRFTWVRFLKDKYESLHQLVLDFAARKGVKIVRIKSDHDQEFKNENLNNFCDSEGIHHEYSASITPQQNGVVEKKNKTLQEMAQVMLHVRNLCLHFVAEAINTTCHIHNIITDLELI